jgi:hypothetical protein
MLLLLVLSIELLLLVSVLADVVVPLPVLGGKGVAVLADHMFPSILKVTIVWLLGLADPR